MSDPRDEFAPENPPCGRCGHPRLRHVFGNGWCTVAVVSIGGPSCRCQQFAPIDAATAARNGLAGIAYKAPA